MPPKGAKAAKADPADSSAEASKSSKVMDDEIKLTWALICQMSSGGKLIGVDWDEVQSQIEAPSKHAAYLRWDALKKRMKGRGFELPKDRVHPEAKAKVTKPKATGVKKPRGRKAKPAPAKEEEEEEEAQPSGGEVSGSGDEEIQDDDANEVLVVATEDEEST